MPQLDPAVFPTQLFWLLLTFVPLYFVIWRVALPKIGDVLEARQDKIDDDLKKAATLKDEAEAVLAQYEAAQAEARASAQSVIRAAQEEMAAEAERRGSELAETLAKQTAEAEARIHGAKTEALGNLHGAVSEVAAAATNRLLDMRPDEDQVKKAVDEAMGGQA